MISNIAVAAEAAGAGASKVAVATGAAAAAGAGTSRLAGAAEAVEAPGSGPLQLEPELPEPLNQQSYIEALLYTSLQR